MLCDACGKNEATYHTIRTYNGIRTETHLCSECRRLLASDAQNDFAGAFFSDVAALFGTCRRTDKHVCSVCGTTEDEFLRTGFVGCENCYKEFSSQIMPRVAQLQQGCEHVGKTPPSLSASPEAEYARLKAELDRATAAEDYKRAAKISEKMKAIRDPERKDNE